ncbi:hypothetical protein PHET_11135 [Paragonimus heterotremus]
MSKRS